MTQKRKNDRPHAKEANCIEAHEGFFPGGSSPQNAEARQKEGRSHRQALSKGKRRHSKF